MKPSAFLRYAAQQCFAGMPIDHARATPEVMEFICLTLPTPEDERTAHELGDTRPMRMLLAAAIAESEGN